MVTNFESAVTQTQIRIGKTIANKQPAVVQIGVNSGPRIPSMNTSPATSLYRRQLASLRKFND